MQTHTQTQSDILQQFSDMLKNHSIVVADRANLVKLLENIVDLCTQMPKTKLKAVVKAAAKSPAAKTPAAKKQPVRETLVGPADAGDCPIMSDLKAPARGRGRPRKADATAVTEATYNDAEKKKRGRPKKDKTVTISSNDDEDALIAKMIADVKKNAKQSAAVAEPAEEDNDSTESELDEFSGELIRAEENHSEETSPVVANSVSPVHQVEPIHSDVPIEVEAEVEAVVVNKTKAKSKQVKEPKVKEPKVKEIKVKETKVKEPKVKEPKVKEPKVKEPKVKEPKQAIAVEVVPVPATQVVPVSVTAATSATSSHPLRENKASSDGNFYLMPNYPRESFTYNGKTYLRTETDNVYDTMTLEMIGVWDHLNHEIITAFDDEEVDELWLSDEE